MRYGFISHVVGDGDSADVLRDNIDLAGYAEDLGFDSFWVAQHHFERNAGTVRRRWSCWLR